MESSIRQRIKQFIEDKNVSINALSNGNSALQRKLQRQINEGANVTVDTIEYLQNYCPQLNSDWLLRGMGEMYLQDNAVMLSAETTGGIPFYDHAIECGTPADFDACIEADKADGKIMLPNIQGDFALVAHGDSMVDVEHPDRSIPSGAIVVLRKIDEITFIRWGEVYALATRDGFVIKRIMPLDSDNIECHSFNGSEFPPFQMRKSDIVGMARVIAVVTCKLY